MKSKAQLAEISLIQLDFCLEEIGIINNIFFIQIIDVNTTNYHNELLSSYSLIFINVISSCKSLLFGILINF